VKCNGDHSQFHMDHVRQESELVARRMQVRELRKIAKKLYLAVKRSGPWTQSEIEAVNYYEKEMK
jgi:hypothetical protein